MSLLWFPAFLLSPFTNLLGSLIYFEGGFMFVIEYSYITCIFWGYSIVYIHIYCNPLGILVWFLISLMAMVYFYLGRIMRMMITIVSYGFESMMFGDVQMRLVFFVGFCSGVAKMKRTLRRMWGIMMGDRNKSISWSIVHK